MSESSVTKKTILVTGGCGFIASNFIHSLLESRDAEGNRRYIVVNVDKLNYCANLKNITKKYNYETHQVEDTDLTDYHFYKTDINNADFILDILRKHRVNIVYHFAAQSHVDQSFGNSNQFVIDNVMGTSCLLECSREYGQLEKFIHVSTDEVYGEITPDKVDAVLKYGLYDPTNPYAATKAAAELMAKSYYRSYKVPVIITRSNNVYGPQQYWEKIVPKFIYQLMKDKKCPIYGNGQALRKYLYVGDACDAYLKIMESGQIGQVYEMSSEIEHTALEMATILVKNLKPDDPLEHWVSNVEDRKFHDQRYIVNHETLKKLGWNPKTSFEKGLARTIEWYQSYAVPFAHWTYDDAVTSTGGQHI
jgi:UDP-glucose 4,6-dehydratase